MYLYGSLLPVNCLIIRSLFVPISAATEVGLNSRLSSLTISAKHLKRRAGFVVAW